MALSFVVSEIFNVE